MCRVLAGSKSASRQAALNKRTRHFESFMHLQVVFASLSLNLSVSHCDRRSYVNATALRTCVLAHWLCSSATRSEITQIAWLAFTRDRTTAGSVALHLVINRVLDSITRRETFIRRDVQSNSRKRDDRPDGLFTYHTLRADATSNRSIISAAAKIVYNFH